MGEVHRYNPSLRLDTTTRPCSSCLAMLHLTYHALSATVSSSVPIVSKLEISATNERSRFRVWLKGPSRSQTVEFDLTPQQAMILMRTLEAFRRKYRWPVPLDPKIERLFC